MLEFMLLFCLYTTNTRLQGPKANGTDISWEDLNLQIGAKLKALAAGGKEVALLDTNFCKPNHQKLVADFITCLSKCKTCYLR